MKHLTFSTGNMYRTMNMVDTNTVLDFLRELNLDIDGYMISLTHAERIKNFDISKENLAHLKNMGWNSIHAPVVNYEDDEETRELIKNIKDIYDKIKAKQVVFHPYNIKEFSMLKNTGMNILVELMLPRHNLKIEDYEKILNENPHISFTHDICHAAEDNLEKIKMFFDRFKDRIKQFHISYAKDKDNWHLPMFKADPLFLKAAECIKELDVEFAIESLLDKPEDIKKEASFCRKWLADQ